MTTMVHNSFDIGQAVKVWIGSGSVCGVVESILLEFANDPINAEQCRYCIRYESKEGIKTLWFWHHELNVV